MEILAEAERLGECQQRRVPAIHDVVRDKALTPFMVGILDELNACSEAVFVNVRLFVQLQMDRRRWSRASKGFVSATNRRTVYRLKPLVTRPKQNVLYLRCDATDRSGTVIGMGHSVANTENGPTSKLQDRSPYPC